MYVQGLAYLIGGWLSRVWHVHPGFGVFGTGFGVFGTGLACIGPGLNTYITIPVNIPRVFMNN
jgi:hypothetical protein